MAERLNKLSEYLYSDNYELALQTHKHNNYQLTTLNELELLKLAKAYHYITSDYGRAVDILNKIKDSKNIDIYYEARMTLFKAGYLTEMNMQLLNNLIFQLKNRITADVKVNAIYLMNIKEIENVLNAKTSRNGPFNAAQLQKQQKDFQQLFKAQDDNSIIMEGMPKFVVSKKWIQAWTEFTSNDRIQKQKKYPGPITQFQVLDHPFWVYQDTNPSKDYTNKYLFNDTEYEVMPKKCWMFLKERYGGIEIKRFNISFVDKPNEIMTEVFLKKIEIAKVQDNKNYSNLPYVILQITKKQNWQGVKNKLANWGPGQIAELDGKKLLSINQSQILEQIDTIGKRYVYAPVSVDLRTSKIAKTVEKCGNKDCQITEKLKFCRCKTIKYCGMDCLKANYKNHKATCLDERACLEQQSVIFKNFSLEEKDYGGMKGKVGLKNLGNTCYMNSGLQCISNTKEITEYFMKDQFKSHINYRNPLGTKGNLACAYAELIREMWTGSSEAVSPFRLKKIIGNVATQFSGYSQQDSQQFISYLIDSLSQDLNLVKNKQNFQVGEQIKPDQQMSKESQNNYAKRIQSYIRNLMTGQFKSTVICSVCQKVSVCFDPYLLISLPIPTNEQWDIFFVPNDLSRGAIKFFFEYNSSLTLERLSKQLTYKYNKKLQSSKQPRQKISPQKLLYILVDTNKFDILKYFQGNQQITSIKSKHFLFCLQVPSIRADQSLFLAQFFYKDEKISFPRFLKIPKQSNASAKETVICQSVQRGLQQGSKVSYHDIVQKQRVVNTTPFLKMEIYCKRKYKLLTYNDYQREGLPKLVELDEIVTFQDCLNNFMHKERLAGDNAWYCNKCKNHQQATKHMEIYKSNKILVLAFKRFSRTKKIRTPVKFPIQNFNMGPYLLSNKTRENIIYDLYGVVNHYGTMGGGHYTAFCQNFLNKKWYEFNDSRVSEISRGDIISGDSYVLFFRRRD